MKNPQKKPRELHRYFLACEFKPHGDLWSILDPFAYNIKPAFIHGSLGIISYKPLSYSIIDVGEKSQPLLGYICTITHPETALLLDKIKGYYGPDAFATHYKAKVKAYTDVDKKVSAWCYVLSDPSLDSYEQIEQVEFGIWDSGDNKQIDLLEKIGESL